MPQHLKCQLCGFKIKAFYFNRKGKMVSGSKIIENHYAVKHFEEWEKLQEQLRIDTEMEEFLNGD